MKRILFVDYEEIGAILFSLAHAINANTDKLKAYYISFGNFERSHDSNFFHFASLDFEWNYAKPFPVDANMQTVDNLDEKIAYLKEVVHRTKPDVVYTSGRGAYVCCRAGLTYCYYAYGSDIEQYAFNVNSLADSFYKHKFLDDYLNCPFDLRDDPFAVSLQDNVWYQGIKHADKITVLPRALNHLRKITRSYKLFHIPHLVLFNGQNQLNKDRSKSLGQKAIFFSSARHCWGGDRDFTADNKGNDVILRSLVMYKQKSGDDNFEIRFVNKGPDVERTKQLAAELNLTLNVVWLREMKRSELMHQYEEATICFGQFGTDCLELNTVEPLSQGVPTIGWYGIVNAFPYNEMPFYKSLPPLFNSKEPLQIADYIVELLKDQQKYADLCRKSYLWCKGNCSIEQVVNAFIALADGSIELIESKGNVDQSQEGSSAWIKRTYSSYFQFYVSYLDLEQRFIDLNGQYYQQHGIIESQNDRLRQKEQEIVQKDETIAQKDQAIAQKDQAIVQKDQSLIEKDQAITQRDQIIEAKDQAISVRDQIIFDKDQYLNSILNSYSWRVYANILKIKDYLLPRDTLRKKVVVDYCLKPLFNALKMAKRAVVYFTQNGLRKTLRRMYDKVSGKVLQKLRERKIARENILREIEEAKKNILREMVRQYSPDKMHLLDAAVMDVAELFKEHFPSGFPSFSIVSVLYGKRKEVKHFLDSIVDQNYPGEVEIILIDDCSPDRSSTVASRHFKKIVKKSAMKPKLSIVKNESNQGNCVSRNRGVASAKNDRVVIIDSDCIMNREFLLSHALAHSFGDPDACIGPFNLETNGGKPKDVLAAYVRNYYKVNEDMVLQDGLNERSFLNCITRNFSIRRDAVQEDLFDPLFSYSKNPSSGFGWEDIEMGYRLYQRGTRVQYAPTAFTVHISHPSSVDEKTKPLRSLKNFRRLFEKHPDLFLASRQWALGTYQNIITWMDNLKVSHNEDNRFLENQFERFLPNPFHIRKERKLRILTYRWHCPHQYELYKLGHDITLVSGLTGGFTNSWEFEQRPMSGNARFKNINDIDPKDYDLAILHFDENVLAPEHTNGVIGEEWGRNFKYFREQITIPKVAICHGTPQFHGQYTSQYLDYHIPAQVLEEERQKMVEYAGDMLIICNSHQSQREWRFKNSKVIWHGFDPAEYPLTTYKKGILSIGNPMKERPHYRGYFLYQKVFEHFSEKDMPGSLAVPKPGPLYLRETNDYAVAKYWNYVDNIREYSIYFNPTLRSPMPRSRGEAMMCGLVNVSANNHDVDLYIKNGVNGFYSNDADELREYLLYLLKNPGKTREIGIAGRRLAMDVFNHDRYLKSWEETIAELAG